MNRSKATLNPSATNSKAPATLTAVTARMVLWVEAATNPRVREALLRGRASMASMLIPALAGIGVRDPLAVSDTLGACVQGLFLQQFARGEAIDPRPLLEIIVRGALT